MGTLAASGAVVFKAGTNAATLTDAEYNYAILQAEELLASISDSLIDNIQSLESFDHEPGEEETEEEEHEREVTQEELVPDAAIAESL